MGTEVNMLDELPLFLHESPIVSPMITIVTVANNQKEEEITDEAFNSVIRETTSVHSLGGPTVWSVDSVPRDEWLPITESRKGNEFYAACHLICSGIGPQALMLPTAFSLLGWTWGLICFTVAFMWQLYTIWLLIRMHESVEGIRYSRYLHLSVASFGEKMGKILALLPVMYLSGGTCVMLIIIGGQTMELFYKTVAEDGATRNLTGTEWFLLFTSVAILTALLFPNLDSISMVSMLGSLAGITYCTMIWVLTIRENRPNEILHAPSSSARSNMERLCEILNGIGMIFLAFRGHNLVLEIQGTLPSSLKRSSYKPMLRATVAAYLVIPSCLVSIAVAGYWAFGDNVRDSGGILKGLSQFHGHVVSKTTLAITCLMLVISCLASFQLYAMPVFDNLEMRYTTIKNQKSPLLVKIFLRVFFGCLTFFLSVTFPFLPSLGSFIGGIALPLTYAYPSFMWIAVKKPSRFSPNWLISSVFGGSGMVLSLLLAAAGLWSLVDEGLDANFFRPS